MATNTYVALKTSTVTGSSVASVTLDTIPSGYTDLVIVGSGKLASDSTLAIKFNGDTAGNYSQTVLYGDGSNVASYRESNQTSQNFALWDTVGSNFIVQVQNYSNSTTYKTCLVRYGRASSVLGAAAVMWRKTPEAITSVTITGGSNIAVGSTFTVYGIAAIGGDTTSKATGGDVYSDSSYYYHIFKGSNTFTALQSLTADILVVAGGGAGGAGYSGGGGGAGGVLYFASQSLSAASYNCIIGAGAAPWVGQYEMNNTNNGNDSQFGSLTLVKGGGAGGVVTTYVAGKSGGSGGGSGGEPTGATGGAGTSGQGNAGGNGTNNGVGGYAGGGGGWGAAGQTATTSYGGDGGAGNYSSFTDAIGALAGVGQLSGGHYYFAGGGGGSSQPNGTYQGVGGLGGGATAKRDSTNGVVGNNATANTGGGGGGVGGTFSGIGGGGGSGIVIVRYAK